MKVSELLCMSGPHRATDYKSKQILEHFIWTYPQFHPETMWEQWETVACSFLPSLSVFGILMLRALLWLHLPHHLCPSQASARDHGTWSLMTQQCSSVTLIPLLQNGKCHNLDWPFSPPSQPSLLTAGALGQTCVCISVWLHIVLQLARCKLMSDTLIRANVVLCIQWILTSILVFPKTKGSFEKPRLEMFGTLSWLTFWGFE